MGFNEARAASPGILKEFVQGAISDYASMRPGQQAPESFGNCNNLYSLVLCFNEARAASPGILSFPWTRNPLRTASMRPGQQAPESRID